ncbi:porin family protein [Ichthyenterobacterium sp. W332]|uniref:Porin family protein n=1 Tax=Microcosmobacter mediterraneus TaxID=3075607 RepID=A0ABU2YI17_9FLAO|nr:porin family protein [Ichthyenterobacterium sp. W332]MDT0557447.1 porin family protein [Ichthyenterobacterium sp. W332]
MKKLFFAALAVFAFASVDAQTGFGLTAGYSNVSIDGESGSGFNVGAFADIGISDSFSVQPELVYTNSSSEDVTYNLFNVNAMAKYHVSEEFSILAGPQIGFASGDVPDALDMAFGDDFSSLNLQLALGVAYSFTENIFAQARYGFQLNEHVEGIGSVNTLNVGVGYRF